MDANLFETQDEFSVVEQTLTTPSSTQESHPPVEELPEKYKGKSAADIARMHQEAEKLISRQGAEVAEVRRLADMLIQRQTATPQPASQPATAPLEDVDFFADPKAAVAKAVASHPAVIRALHTTQNLAQNQSFTTFKTMHPDYKEILADPEYTEWVNKSPIRQQLFQQADKNYDYMAGDELFSTWKELKELRKARSSAQVAEVSSRQSEALNAAVVPAVGGSSESPSKKVFRRAELINLQLRDPQRYQMLQPEIMAAYQEGRVR